jgi:hypothetical protein
MERFVIEQSSTQHYTSHAGLTGPLSPLRHPAKRRRPRTVMQGLMA